MEIKRKLFGVCEDCSLGHRFKKHLNRVALNDKMAEEACKDKNCKVTVSYTSVFKKELQLELARHEGAC